MGFFFSMIVTILARIVTKNLKSQTLLWISHLNASYDEFAFMDLNMGPANRMLASAGRSGRPIFVETPLAWIPMSMDFDRKMTKITHVGVKIQAAGWCFRTRDFYFLKIHEKTFQTKLISSHLDMLARFSAHLKFTDFDYSRQIFENFKKIQNILFFSQIRKLQMR